MNDLKEKTVGMLVAEQPLRAAVFDRLNIDYCCGGKQILSVACTEQGIDVSQVIAQLLETDTTLVKEHSGKPWLSASLSDLVEHIEQTHHAFLKIELPRLKELADKVARVHGLRESRLKEAAAVFSAMKQEIETHTKKEELILFPYIKQIGESKIETPAPFGSIANPIQCMESEHSDAGDALLILRELTDGYTAPEHACTSWKALFAGLANLDQDLRTHIHKENSILFPKAIAAQAAHN